MVNCKVFSSPLTIHNSRNKLNRIDADDPPQADATKVRSGTKADSIINAFIRLQ